MKFDPACAFLLNLGFENLFEQIGSEGRLFRCKGCHDEVERRERKPHWSRHRAHRRQYAQAHQKEVQQATETITEAFDRALGDFAEPPNGRPEDPVTEEKEAEMPTKKTAARPATRKKKSAAAPQKARSATATAPPKEATEKGTVILAALYKALEAEVGPFEKAPNDAGQYTKLRVGGKSFAYIYAPTASSVLVKIPKPLLHIASGLPKGHPFAVRKWGISTTAKSTKDVPAIVKGLKVAHAAATPDEDAPTAREAEAASN